MWKKIIAGLCVLIGAASYGLLSTVTKLAYQRGFTTGEMTGSQMLFGCIGFWLCSVKFWPRMFQIPVRTIAALLLGGAVSALTGIFYYLALQQLAASFAVILLFQFAWMGILIDWALHQQRPTKWHWLSIAFILAGTYLAAGYQLNFATDGFSVTGTLLGLLAAVTYTIFINLSGHLATGVDVLVRNTWMVTGSMVFSFIVFPPRFLFNGAISSGLWFWGGFLGFFGVLIPFYLFAKGVPRIGSGMAAILGAVELPVVIIMSAIWLYETITIVQWIGVLIILVGVATPILPQYIKLFHK